MNFDLNIGNYKKQELEDIFQLPKNYDSNVVEMQESKLRENIAKNASIDKDVKEKTMKFLSEAKKIIINTLFSGASNLSSTIDEFYNSSYDLKEVPLDGESGTHYVEQRKKKPYLSSYPSEFFPGVINPIKKKDNLLNLNIDTRFRENYYTSQSTNFHLDLPIKLNSVLTMRVSSFEALNCFYCISKQLGNNFFTIRDTSVTPNVSVVLTVPDGNYNYSDLLNLLNNFLFQLTEPQYANIKKLIFTVNTTSGNSGTRQMIIAIQLETPVSPVFSYEIDFQADSMGNYDTSTPLPLKFGWICGFRNGIYTNNTSYVSEGIMDLAGPRYIYLVIDDYNNNVNNGFYSSFTSSILNKNILARISVNAAPFTVIHPNVIELLNYPRKYYGPVDIQKMTVQLLDEYGRILDMNNMDYSFCLTFQTVYDI